MDNYDKDIEIIRMELNTIDESIKSKRGTLKIIINTFIIMNSGLFFLLFKYIGKTSSSHTLILSIFSYLNFVAIWALISLASRKLAELYSLMYYQNRIRRKIIKAINNTNWANTKELALDYLQNNKPVIPKTLIYFVPYILALYNFSLLMSFNILLYYKNEDYCIWGLLAIMMGIIVFYPNVCTRFWIRTVPIWGSIKFSEVDKKIRSLHKNRKKRKKKTQAKVFKTILISFFVIYVTLWLYKLINKDNFINYTLNSHLIQSVMVSIFVIFVIIRLDYEILINTNNSPLKPLYSKTESLLKKIYLKYFQHVLYQKENTIFAIYYTSVFIAVSI
ncbi:hypothetical protein [Desulfovibrio gilichinskyi]|uniref:Uncharacterized protein n=1 Tax=Desulfovibrio gilichinskyi TaxID=1519643 RepID=A0A1X7D7I0_9BACT|nr:hypothetical protein [Desulfovibrio gilichinskyi]SMF09952.1 hypothetical protein SAMN06295933_1735 [Desulfovibrio gilichinskyi]